MGTVSVIIYYRILLLTAFWIVVDHYAKALLLLSFLKLKANSRRGFKIINILRYSGYCLINTLLMIHVLSVVLNSDFLETVFVPFTAMDNLNMKYLSDERVPFQFIFIQSYYLFSVIRTGITKCFNGIEFLGKLIFACLFLQGYFCGFLEFILIIGCLSNALELLKAIHESFQYVNESYPIKFPFYLFVASENFYWLWMYLYLIPVYYFPQILLLKFEEISHISSLILFKVLFLAYYLSEILNYPMSQITQFWMNYFVYKRTNANKSMKKSYNIHHKMRNEQNSNMYTVQSKPTSGMKKQQALMQVIRCAIALKKKTQRIKESKEKLHSLEINK